MESWTLQGLHSYAGLQLDQLSGVVSKLAVSLIGAAATQLLSWSDHDCDSRYDDLLFEVRPANTSGDVDVTDSIISSPVAKAAVRLSPTCGKRLATDSSVMQSMEQADH